MNLESLLKPLKFADEQILRQYTKLTQRWEDKGHSRYSLAHIFNLSGCFSGLNLSFLPGLKGMFFLSSLNPTSYGLFYSIDICRNVCEPLIEKIERYSKNRTMRRGDIVLEPLKKFTNFSRLPCLLVGAGLMVKSGYEFFDYIKTGNGESLNSGISDLFSGYSFFGFSSSVYIKDSDPKILDKAPFWKTAYESIREKIKNLIPNPLPQPIPEPQPTTALRNY